MTKAEIEAKIISDYDEYMKKQWDIFSLFSDATEPKSCYELGFITGMAYVGSRLGIDLWPLTDEERGEIDKIFED